MPPSAAYTPPPPKKRANPRSKSRSSHVRVRPTAAATQAKVPKAPKLPREGRVSAAPPPAPAALQLLQGGRSSKPSVPWPVASDTIEMRINVAEPTKEIPAPELRAAETHRRLAAREKRQKKLARARVKKDAPRKLPAKELAGEKSGIRIKAKRSAPPPPPPAVRKRRTGPPPVPAKARRTAPPPIPAAARRKSAPPALPAPRKSVASFAPPPPSVPMASVAPPAPAPKPQLAKVLHIPSRETTRQFPLPERDRPATVIPLSRVAPNDIAVPLVPTAPMPLTRIAQPEVPAAAPSSTPIGFTAGRPNTQRVLTEASSPFDQEDPEEDLLAPYRASPMRSFKRAIETFFG